MTLPSDAPPETARPRSAVELDARAFRGTFLSLTTLEETLSTSDRVSLSAEPGTNGKRLTVDGDTLLPYATVVAGDERKLRAAFVGRESARTVVAFIPVGPGQGDAVPRADEPPLFAEEELKDLMVVAVGRGNDFFCTGVLVAPDVVLTAAHCLPATDVGIGPEIGRLVVTTKVVDVIRNPDTTVDLVALRTATSFPGVAPAIGSADDHASEDLMAIGFGLEFDDTSLSGRKHDVMLRSDDVRCDARRTYSSGCDPSHELVVVSQNGHDTCDGDSGGPLLARDHRQDAKGPVLIGITSRPVANAARRCGDGGIYVRLDSVQPWLDSFLDLASEGGLNPNPEDR